MSFGTSNKFAVLQQVQPKQPKPKGEKIVNALPGPKNEKSASKDELPVSEKKNNENNNRGESRPRGNRGGNRGNRGGNRGGRGGSSVDRPPRDPNQPPKNRTKREFDRLSTAPKNEVKKSNFGTGNWGTEKEDERGVEDAKKEIDSSAVKVDEVKAEEVVEPEPKTLTLKEYEEQLAALAPKIDAPKRREAGEGEKSDLHKYVVLKRDDDDEFKQLHNNNIKIKEKKKKQNKKTVVPLADVLNVNNVDDRKGKKPYNSKYNNNNNRKPKKVNISIEDTDSFPALK